MADYRIVKTKFWGDPYITTLDTHNKLLFLYFLTNSCTDISGAYEISIRRIEFDTGLVDSLIHAGMRLFEEDKKIYYKDGWIFIPNFIKNQQLNESVKIGIVKSLKKAPEWVQKLADWYSLGTASPQPATKKEELSKEKKESSFINNSREKLKEKWGTKK